MKFPMRSGIAPMALCLFLTLLAAPPAAAREFIGVVHPTRDLTLSVRVNGVVDRVHVKVGQRVKAGQTLLELDAALQRIELDRRRTILEDASEQASVEERYRILERLHKDASQLYEQAGTISREELMKMRIELVTLGGRRDQLRIEKQRERHEFELARQERQMRLLEAPIAGVVTAVEVDVGEWATPGQPVVRLVDESEVELRVDLSQAAARRLKVGDGVQARLDDLGADGAVSGRVSFLSPVADAASGLVEMRVRIPNADRRIRPGVKGRIRIEGLGS